MEGVYFGTWLHHSNVAVNNRAQAEEQTLTPLPQAHSQTLRFWPHLHGPGSDTHLVTSKEGQKQMCLDWHCILSFANLTRSGNGNVVFPCL